MNVLSRVSSYRLTGRRALVASLIGAALTAVCAQIAFYLPGKPVPVTMQVFAVICCGLVLGSRWAALAQIEFLTAGLLGAPVFAGFRAGPAALAGPTGGYLVGFVAAAFIVGFAFETASRRNFASACLAGAMGVCVIYTFGVAWLSVWLGPRFSGFVPWMIGVAPFVGVDAVKVVVAAMLCAERSNN